ncbi:hypothetical protein ACHHYP_02107 [Achlya hypogyna]|uniref:Uncharacterized protein n=1 Tax=Achlya hypogyna TaxID=1202772 RepID=A0A1V9Z7A8_ACHHY|nr:hypothetical protein ACHHYP_02107 [Achlya hypogyna]
MQVHTNSNLALAIIQYKWRMYYQKTLAIYEMTPRDKAAARIQGLWRGYTNKRIYRYYRDLVNFRNTGDPMLMLKAINPSEAHLLDAATNAQVRFRLGGAAFPPTIYYKIFTRGAVCDMNAFSPKDYTTAHQVGPRNINVHASTPGTLPSAFDLQKVGRCGADANHSRWKLVLWSESMWQ